MKYLVRPAGASAPAKSHLANDAISVDLYSRPGDARGLTAGASILQDVRRADLNPSVRAWDFLTIALAAIVADAATLRRSSPDGWTREISLDLALAEPGVWKPHLSLLTNALAFLTTDIWDIEITTKAGVPFKPKKSAAAPEADCVALLSGGLDSLVGGIDIVSAGKKPFFVSQTVRGDAAKQEDFARRLAADLPFIQLNHSTNTAGVAGPDETSQRVRSLIFIAYAVLIASTITTPDGDPVDLYVNENGFISINPLSLAGSDLTLSDGGGTVTLPSGGGGSPYPQVAPEVARIFFPPFTTTGTSGINQNVYCTRLALPYGSIVEIGIEITTVQAGGALRLGLYAPDAHGFMPKTLLVDAGTVDTSTTGWKTVVLAAPIAWTGGPIYGAVYRPSTSATPNVRTAVGGSSPQPVALVDWGGYPSSNSVSNGGFYMTGNHDAGLPATFTPANQQFQPIFFGIKVAP